MYIHKAHYVYMYTHTCIQVFMSRNTYHTILNNIATIFLRPKKASITKGVFLFVNSCCLNLNNVKHAIIFRYAFSRMYSIQSRAILQDRVGQITWGL